MQFLFGYDLFLLMDYNILPKKELHSSPWVEICFSKPCFLECLLESLEVISLASQL